MTVPLAPDRALCLSLLAHLVLLGLGVYAFATGPLGCSPLAGAASTSSSRPGPER